MILMRSVFCWLRAICVEIFALLLVFFLHPFRYLKQQKIGLGQKKGRPILLVHGYLHDSSAWMYMRRKLVKEGFGPIYTINLGFPFFSIRTYAERVAKKAEAIEKETGCKELMLVGHSMGGLVSLWYASKLAAPNKVTHLVAIGSPLQGTYVAKIGLGADAREMERGSQFVDEIQKVLEKFPGQFYTIASKTDLLIFPYASALRGNQKLFEDIGHVSMLFSPRVAETIANWLPRN